LTAQSKDALIKNLSINLGERKLVIPQREIFPELVNELEAFEYTVTESKHYRTGAPYGCHDDCVIALALAAWNLKERPRVQMVSTIPPEFFYANDFCGGAAHLY
jgi:hypothetical protein